MPGGQSSNRCSRRAIALVAHVPMTAAPSTPPSMSCAPAAHGATCPRSMASTAHRRLQRWQQEGAWQRIHRTLLGMLERRKRIDWSSDLLDGSFVPAKRGRCGWPDRDGEGQSPDARHRRERPAARDADDERGHGRGAHGGGDADDHRGAAEERQAEIPAPATDRGQGVRQP
jgi:hypothetical protein